MPSRMFIHATNVHQGGGRCLLDALLKELNGNVQHVLLLDKRMPVPIGLASNVQIKWVKPSILQRLAAERWLAKNVTLEDVVLCFGNLPPLLGLRGHVVVFVHNRYLVENVKLNLFSLKARWRLALERLWFSRRILIAKEFIVQTPTMKHLLEKKTQGRVPVRVSPFVAEPNSYSRSFLQSKVKKKDICDFVYVASGEPHKNHRRLMEAWCFLAEEGIFPSLYLTLDESRFAEISREIDILSKRYGLKVKNVGELPHQKALNLIKKSGAMIYPSVLESFGLPLVEARQAGIKVLASELDYVRDIIDPDQSFDPYSSLSIARAVKRHLIIDEPVLQLLDSAKFLQFVYDKFNSATDNSNN